MKNRRSRLTTFRLTLSWFLWEVKEPTPLFEKNRGRRPRWCSQPSHTSFTHHSHHGLGGYSKLKNGLRAAVSGAIVCWRPSLLLTSIMILYIVKRARLLSSHPWLLLFFFHHKICAIWKISARKKEKNKTKQNKTKHNKKRANIFTRTFTHSLPSRSYQWLDQWPINLTVYLKFIFGYC